MGNHNKYLSQKPLKIWERSLSFSLNNHEKFLQTTKCLSRDSQLACSYKIKSPGMAILQ